METSPTDFTIIADGGEIRCHKAILAMFSTFFRASFNSGMKDSNKLVKLPTLRYDILNKIIEMMYDRCLAGINKRDSQYIIDVKDFQYFREMVSIIFYLDIRSLSDIVLKYNIKIAIEDQDEYIRIVNQDYEHDRSKIRDFALLLLKNIEIEDVQLIHKDILKYITELVPNDDIMKNVDVNKLTLYSYLNYQKLVVYEEGGVPFFDADNNIIRKYIVEYKVGKIWKKDNILNYIYQMYKAFHKPSIKDLDTFIREKIMDTPDLHGVISYEKRFYIEALNKYHISDSFYYWHSNNVNIKIVYKGSINLTGKIIRINKPVIHVSSIKFSSDYIAYLLLEDDKFEYTALKSRN